MLVSVLAAPLEQIKEEECKQTTCMEYKLYCSANPMPFSSWFLSASLPTGCLGRCQRNCQQMEVLPIPSMLSTSFLLALPPCVITEKLRCPLLSTWASRQRTFFVTQCAGTWMTRWALATSCSLLLLLLQARLACCV
eukprot:1159870-Pelagomonas_calceolata.AAC.10